MENIRKPQILIQTDGITNTKILIDGMELELFEIKESTVNNPDGSVRINKTTKVTGKGQQYFINKFLGQEIPV